MSVLNWEETNHQPVQAQVQVHTACLPAPCHNLEPTLLCEIVHVRAAAEAPAIQEVHPDQPQLQPQQGQGTAGGITSMQDSELKGDYTVGGWSTFAAPRCWPAME